MSNNTSSNWQTRPKLERQLLSNKPKIIITEDIIDKIKYLCKNIDKVEWSGVLFYTINGSIKDANNMQITLRDILPMHKGDHGTTGFDWDEDVVTYQMDNPESIDWIKGHIHSHHTMGVFFSGTDWDELNDNCTAHNFYLSVIVNNYLDIMAKIAFTAQAPTNQFICKDEEGKDYTLSLTTNGSLKPFMFVYDCIIDMPDVSVKVPESFVDRVAFIEKKHEEANKSKTTVYTGEAYNKYNNDKYREAPEKSAFPDYVPKNKRKGNEENWNEAEDWQTFINGYGGDSPANVADSNDEIDFTQSTIEQDFAGYLIRLGNITEEDDELIDALEDAEEAGVDSVTFSESIRDQYGALYEQFFDKYTKYLDNDDIFLEVLAEVIGIYEEHEGDYPLLTPIIEKLKEVGIKMEAYIENKKHAKQE